MNCSKQAFIRLCLESGVLKFGDFQLKSGRISPYFFNAGLFYHGRVLRELGRFYAEKLVTEKVEFQHLFGPAYKGLPLATATSIALADMDINSTVTFNRKEAKDHGELGLLIGAPLTGKTVLIDDVITSGKSFREAKELIQNEQAQLTDVIIALDRCEQGQSKQSTLSEINDQGIKVHAIITFFDLIDYLQEQEDVSIIDRLLHYHQQYGC